MERFLFLLLIRSFALPFKSWMETPIADKSCSLFQRYMTLWGHTFNSVPLVDCDRIWVYSKQNHGFFDIAFVLLVLLILDSNSDSSSFNNIKLRITSHHFFVCFFLFLLLFLIHYRQNTMFVLFFYSSFTFFTNANSIIQALSILLSLSTESIIIGLSHMPTKSHNIKQSCFNIRYFCFLFWMRD